MVCFTTRVTGEALVLLFTSDNTVISQALKLNCFAVEQFTHIVTRLSVPINTEFAIKKRLKKLLLSLARAGNVVR